MKRDEVGTLIALALVVAGAWTQWGPGAAACALGFALLVDDLRPRAKSKPREEDDES